MKTCKNCPHTRDQHDEDGFCEVEDGILGYCKCQAYEEKTDETAGAEDD